jgi:6-phosphogluconate dehydrogenase
MQIGWIGLGKMGMNMARRLRRGEHQVVAYNRTAEKVEQLVEETGAAGAADLDHLAAQLSAPRVVWLMVPAGDPVEENVAALSRLLVPGDIVVDGGNSYFKDDIRRAEALREKGIGFLDAGVSGGIWGLSEGYCLMIGGERALYDRLEPVLATLAPPGGYLYCGKTGSGHFVKMVHNGIEYGMMQAYAEGFEVLEASDYADGFDYAEISRLWNRGSVVRSWLLELLQDAFVKDGRLETIRGYVEDSGEGRWTLQQAVETGVPVPVIAQSLFARFRSRTDNTFADRVLAALRREFGGHAVQKADR